MTYEELWVAQVRAKARGFARIYSTLQHLIKSRTKAGYIHGYYKEDCIPGGDYLWNKRIRHESDTIKVTIVIQAYPPNNRCLSIHFCTKR